MSTKNEEFGLTSPVSSFLGSPSSGNCQSDTRSLSLPPTMIDLLSFIQRTRARPRSIEPPRLFVVPVAPPPPPKLPPPPPPRFPRPPPFAGGAPAAPAPWPAVAAELAAPAAEAAGAAG